MHNDDAITLLFYLFIRQMGGLADCFRHIQSGKQGVYRSPEEVRGWIVYAQTELADTIELVKKACQILNLNYDRTEEIGRSRTKEKSEEYLKRHPGAFWL